MSLNATLKSSIHRLLKENNIDETRILSRNSRSMEEQIGYVLDGWKYSKTKNAFKKKFNIKSDNELPKSKKDLTSDQRKGLESIIRGFAEKGIGFRHLGGRAIDIWVKGLSIEKKNALYKSIVSENFRIILEKIDSKKGIREYYLLKSSMDEVTTFHVEMGKPSDSEERRNRIREDQKKKHNVEPKKPKHPKLRISHLA